MKRSSGTPVTNSTLLAAVKRSGGTDAEPVKLQEGQLLD
jgi:hypothetical protein